MDIPLFLNKYQPTCFNDFETDSEMIDILNTLININNLNILFIGDIGCGKTAFLNAVICEYYKTSQHSFSNPSLYEDKALITIVMMSKHSVKLAPLLKAKKKSSF